MIAIIGGGITGLALGWELDLAGVPFQVFEAADRPGGVIRSGVVDGHVLDWGPQRVRLTAGLDEMIRDLKLGEEVIRATGGMDLFVYHSGRLRKVPFDLQEFLRTDALSWKGKARLLLEPFLPGPSPEESVGRFLRRKLGREVYDHIVGPLYGGLYSSDPDDMVMRLSLQKVLDHFGIGRSLVARLVQNRASIPRPPAISFRGGMQVLTDALAERLGDRIRLGCRADAIRRVGDRWEVRAGESVVKAEHVVLCLPAGPAAGLLSSSLPEAAKRIARLRYNPLAVVHVQSDADLSGLGFKVSFAEETPLRGVTYNHSVFARTGLYSVYLGGSSQQDVVDLPDEELGALGVQEFERTVGASARVLAVRRERMPAWDASWGALDGLELPPTLHIAANWESRPGVPGRLAQARAVARRLVTVGADGGRLSQTAA